MPLSGKMFRARTCTWHLASPLHASHIVFLVNLAFFLDTCAGHPLHTRRFVKTPSPLPLLSSVQIAESIMKKACASCESVLPFPPGWRIVQIGYASRPGTPRLPVTEDGDRMCPLHRCCATFDLRGAFFVGLCRAPAPSTPPGASTPLLQHPRVAGSTTTCSRRQTLDIDAPS